MTERLGKYTLERRIGAGGMAEVFLSREEGGRQCVIKRMLPNLLIDPEFSQMFLDEAKLVVQLNHEGIAQVYDFGQDKGVLFLAMEWIDGTDLRAIVKDRARRAAPLPIEHCARLVSQAALALGYAHQATGLDGKPLRIIHRDVSPQNILLGHTGGVKLIDFGVAKATSSTQITAAGMIKGKFAYMSPEHLRGEALDGRSDIFGLGLVLYELLTAERAIPGKSEAEIARNALAMNLIPLENKRPDVPASLLAIVHRALKKDRGQRYDTAEQMSAELEAFIAARTPALSNADLARLLAEMQPVPAKTTAGQATSITRRDVRPRGSSARDARPGAASPAPAQSAWTNPRRDFKASNLTILDPPRPMASASRARIARWVVVAVVIWLIGVGAVWRLTRAGTGSTSPQPGPSPDSKVKADPRPTQ